MANDYMAKLAADLDGMTMGGLASKGRYGDTMIAHINPQEAQMLMEEGGSGTINPMTGLPEFFWSADTSADEEGEAGDQGAADYTFDEAMEAATQAMADMAAAEEAKEAAIEVARNRPDINETSKDFLTRLDNSIAGKTQSPDGKNIGLTQDEIASLGFYTENPDDPRFGKYLGYNNFVAINAFKSKDEEDTRQDIAYTDRLNQEFKDKGLDARIAPDPNMKDNYVYTGPDATQAFLGELGSGIFNTVAGFGAMMLDATQMTPGGFLTGMAFGRDLLAPQVFEGKSIAGPGKAFGKTIGLVNEKGEAPLEGLYNSITSSIKSGLGIGTDKQIEQTVLKDNPDKITVGKNGEIKSVSKGGEERSLSGVLTPAQVTESVLGGKLPTDAEVKAMTSGGSPSEYDLYFGGKQKGTSLLGPAQAFLPYIDEVTIDPLQQNIANYVKAMGGLEVDRTGSLQEPSLDVLKEVVNVDSDGRETIDIRGGPQISAQIEADPTVTTFIGSPTGDLFGPVVDLDKAYKSEFKDIREGMGSGLPGPESIGPTSPDYPAFADLAAARAETNLTTPSTAFVDQPDRFDDPGGNEPIVRRKPITVSQAIDEAVEEDKPYFPEVRLPRLTESGLKTLQYTLRNDPEALQNIYNKYALPEQYSGLKALV
jgi:hypothetical protein